MNLSASRQLRAFNLFSADGTSFNGKPHIRNWLIDSQPIIVATTSFGSSFYDYLNDTSIYCLVISFDADGELISWRPSIDNLTRIRITVII